MESAKIYPLNRNRFEGSTAPAPDRLSDLIEQTLASVSFYQLKVLGERFFDCCWKHCVAVLISLEHQRDLERDLG